MITEDKLLDIEEESRNLPSSSESIRWTHSSASRRRIKSSRISSSFLTCPPPPHQWGGQNTPPCRQRGLTPWHCQALLSSLLVQSSHQGGLMKFALTLHTASTRSMKLSSKLTKVNSSTLMMRILLDAVEPSMCFSSFPTMMEPSSSSVLTTRQSAKSLMSRRILQ